MPIRLLPPEVAGKIAAGEVVERPASIVKELIENSLDAQARDIRIEIRDGGRRLIRVADDGCGIPAEEAALAFARHSTSKLTSAADLDRIATLGFRGEALASISAVSQVTVLTRPRDQVIGQSLRVNGGQLVHQEGCGCPAGTIITVEHLFNNVPARLKFLRQAPTEAGHIHRVVIHYAMAYPLVRFNLLLDGREAFQSTGSGQLYDVLIRVYGLEMVEQMLSLTAPEAEALPPGWEGERAGPLPDTALRISGFVGTPTLHRANREYLSLFVNGRWIQDRSLGHAVAQAYHTLLPIGRHPVAVIMIDLDPGEVDVNVHPTKREVRFRDGRRVFSAVQRAVRRALIDRSPVPIMAHTARTWPVEAWDRPGTAGLPGHPTARPGQMALDLVRTGAPGEEPVPVGPVRLPLLRVVGQVGQTYIVAEGPQGLYLIDQHAAHERVLYEQLLQQREQQDIPSQNLLEPAALELDPLLAAILDEQMAALNSLGFRIEPFGYASYLLRAVPAILAQSDPRADLIEILEALHQGQDLLGSRSEARLIAAVCKRAAVKAGQTLSQEEMQNLVRQLEQCASPRTCPHGRPTVLHFSVERLQQEFGRR